MRKLANLGFLVILILTSCTASRSTQITRSWTSNEKNVNGYDNIYITAMIADPIKRRYIEEDIKEKLNTKEIRSTASHATVRHGLWVSNNLDKDEMLQIVRKYTKQAIMTISIIDIQETERYIPGQVMAAGPMMVNPMMANPMWGAGAWPMGGAFGNFWGWNQPLMMTPGYFVVDRKYFLEINIYDVETEALVWSAQSRTMNPKSLENFSSGFALAVIEQMQEEGVLKQQLAQ